ncbi:MAG: YkgJ family cysteine cluster protein [Deltaproteobacteria bacterium]|nr:YkgJ family cysteine cluster protein [Deltaproteobacteria bacterium]MBW2070119.1 YkgJ family cysteine cluster protein [Deltaproteobacteria bacterium]
MIDQALMHPIPGGRFNFACHHTIPCFTKCCAKLDLILTPYDVIRLKTRLNLSSKVFLRRYTTSYVAEEYGAPLVKLKMNEDKDRKCPFVGPQGCSVYEDRPGACRMYPVGRAASKIPGMAKAGEYYFLVKEAHCLGFQQKKEWTIDEWLEDQGLSIYNTMNDLFLDVTAGIQPNIMKSLNEKQIGMFYMACYNLDEFRKFIFSTTFLDRFDVEPDVVTRIKTDDIELLRFACSWLRFALFGENTIATKPDLSPQPARTSR